MANTQLRIFSFLTLITLLCLLLSIYAKSLDSISSSDIHESDLQQCPTVQHLSKLKLEVDGTSSTFTRRAFNVLFPFGPAWNSILGTFYISSVPNFILAFIPAEINRDTLNTMTAFATGGLLSDVFLHLIPHSFLGEHQGSSVRVVMVDDKRNIIIGLAIFVGFGAFFMMEKTFRVLGDEDEGSHGHSNTHSHASVTSGDAKATASGISTLSNGELRSRHAKEENSTVQNDSEHVVIHKTSKLSAYLNLFGDFTHNITDGLAMAASFYSSPLIGATTTLACFAHEIPHEIADYSILVRSGFTKRQAMMSQFLTAIGAFVGTFIGIAIHNMSSGGSSGESLSPNLSAAIRGEADGFLGTTAAAGDLVIPFVAGGFMYIGAVAVLPALLQESKSGVQALREFAAMAIGVGCMFVVAWNE